MPYEPDFTKLQQAMLVPVNAILNDALDHYIAEVRRYTGDTRSRQQLMHDICLGMNDTLRWVGTEDEGAIKIVDREPPRPRILGKARNPKYWNARAADISCSLVQEMINAMRRQAQKIVTKAVSPTL